MKIFHQLSAFQQEVSSLLSKGTPPRCLAVALGSRELRRSLLEKVGQQIANGVRGTFSRLEAGSWDRVANRLLLPSLFGEEDVLVWDIGAGVSKSDQEFLTAYSKKPSERAFLLLGIDSMKVLSSMDKEIDFLCLNQTEEKPWEKEKRLKQEIQKSFYERRKKISPTAVDLLFSGVGGEELLLHSEIDKLCLYVDNKSTIDENDLLAIGAQTLYQAGWHQAESLAWGGNSLFENVDHSFLIGLIGQVRFLLQQAKNVADLLQEKKEPSEISERLQIKPFQMKKILSSVDRYQNSYFNQGIDVLYEMELRTKSGAPFTAKFLLGLLRIQLAKARKVYAR